MGPALQQAGLEGPGRARPGLAGLLQGLRPRVLVVPGRDAVELQARSQGLATQSGAWAGPGRAEPGRVETRRPAGPTLEDLLV